MIEQHPSNINLKYMNKYINKSGKPPAFLLGNEGKGIPSEILDNSKAVSRMAMACSLFKSFIESRCLIRDHLR